MISKFFLNGVIDDQGSLQFQGNYNWFQKNEDPSPKDEKGPAAAAAPHLSPVMQAQSYVGTATLLRAQLHKIRAKSVVQIEQEYYGKDFVLTLKASSHNVFQTLLPARKLRDLFTPNGSYSAAYMHRITKNLSIGAEYTHQYFGERLQDSMMSYAVRYAAYPKEQYPQPPAFPPSIPSPFPPVSLKEPERSFVAIFSPSVGILYSSFYQRLSQRLEAFADINIPTMKPPENAPPHSTAGTLSLGFKLDTLNSTMRTMVDSSLTVVTTIEERLFPGFSVQISARTNHGSDNTGVGHVGLSFALES